MFVCHLLHLRMRAAEPQQAGVDRRAAQRAERAERAELRSVGHKGDYFRTHYVEGWSVSAPAVVGRNCVNGCTKQWGTGTGEFQVWAHATSDDPALPSAHELSIAKAKSSASTPSMSSFLRRVPPSDSVSPGRAAEAETVRQTQRAADRDQSTADPAGMKVAFQLAHCQCSTLTHRLPLFPFVRRLCFADAAERGNAPSADSARRAVGPLPWLPAADTAIRVLLPLCCAR